MPIQTFKISRPPEEPRLDAEEIRGLLWNERSAAEWSVLEITKTQPQDAADKTCQGHDGHGHWKIEIKKTCSICGGVELPLI